MATSSILTRKWSRRDPGRRPGRVTGVFSADRPQLRPWLLEAPRAVTGSSQDACTQLGSGLQGRCSANLSRV